jgi:hypothetical protein
MVDIPPTILPTNIFVVPVNRFEVLMAVTVSNVIHQIFCAVRQLGANVSQESVAFIFGIRE